jgi:N-hydroxyarylamine O-acetyltransferase
MEVDALLARIGAARPGAPTSAALAALHRAYLRAVPSENYDIHLGVPISLAVPDLYDKIVGRNRGGFCYELNGLFAALLRELGFRVRLVSAFFLEDGSRGAEFEHLRLIVRSADDLWLADVGNGASWSDPLPLRPGTYGDVRVHRAGDLWWTSVRRSGGRWEREWAWTPVARDLADFTQRCRYQEHDPASHFVARRFAVLPTEDGRISLLNGVFSEIRDGERTGRRVGADQERALLADRFGIVVDGSWRPPLPADGAAATS